MRELMFQLLLSIFAWNDTTLEAKACVGAFFTGRSHIDI